MVRARDSGVLPLGSRHYVHVSVSADRSVFFGSHVDCSM